MKNLLHQPKSQAVVFAYNTAPVLLTTTKHIARFTLTHHKGIIRTIVFNTTFLFLLNVFTNDIAKPVFAPVSAEYVKIDNDKYEKFMLDQLRINQYTTAWMRTQEFINNNTKYTSK